MRINQIVRLFTIGYQRYNHILVIFDNIISINPSLNLDFGGFTFLIHVCWLDNETSTKNKLSLTEFMLHYNLFINKISLFIPSIADYKIWLSLYKPSHN